MKRKKYNRYEVLEEHSIMYVNRKNEQIEVLVDNDDIEKVISIGAWHAISDKTLQVPSYYIAHRFSDGGVIKLHRLITQCPKDKVVDHINHNTLDNRKCNLRVCTIFENQQNLRSCKSGITGVYQRKNGRWVANISKNNKKYIKEFKTFEDAVKERQIMFNTLYKEVV